MGVTQTEDFYRKNPADQIREILGSGLESNPKEWNKLINEMKSSGIEIVYRDGTMAYSPGLKDVSAQLWENYRQEREYILNLFKE